MSKGIKIAKPNYDVNDSPEHLYVDSDTPLLKVNELVTGSFTSDGTNRMVTWTGTYPGVTVDNTTNGYFFTVTIPHLLNYVPTYMAYADLNPSDFRVYVTSSSQGILVTGAVTASAYADENYLYLTWQGTVSDGMGNKVVPRAGTYGYAVYLFYDELGPLV